MELITLTAAQKKARRNRNIALGIVLSALAVVFYVVTLIKVSDGFLK